MFNIPPDGTISASNFVFIENTLLEADTPEGLINAIKEFKPSKETLCLAVWGQIIFRGYILPISTALPISILPEAKNEFIQFLQKSTTMFIAEAQKEISKQN